MNLLLATVAARLSCFCAVLQGMRQIPGTNLSRVEMCFLQTAPCPGAGDAPRASLEVAGGDLQTLV